MKVGVVRKFCVRFTCSIYPDPPLCQSLDPPLDTQPQTNVTLCQNVADCLREWARVLRTGGSTPPTASWSQVASEWSLFAIKHPLDEIPGYATDQDTDQLNQL